MEATLTFLEHEGHGKAALRIRPPKKETHTPVHCIVLLDVSDSMALYNKLTHVKHCMNVLLNVLTPSDQLSLITFGKTSEILLNRESIRPSLAATIESLQTSGSTNLSAGLENVRRVLADAVAANSVAKPGLLLLTDGHANRGVFDPTRLKELVKGLQESVPSLSASFIAYGTDHNATLLSSFAQDCHGSYSIVESLEGAALAMGEGLGNLTSCALQSLTIQCARGTEVEGEYTCSEEGTILVGDVLEGCELLILLDIPSSPGASSIRITGTDVSTMETVSVDPIVKMDTRRNLEIELTRLRYTVCNLFRRIREETDTETNLREEVERLRTTLTEDAYRGHPIQELLLQELPSLEAALDARNYVDPHVMTQILQHETFTLLGRGTTQPISDPSLLQRYATPISTQGDEEEDPSAPAGPTRFTPYMSPMASSRTRDMATNLQRLTSQRATDPTTETPRHPRRFPMS